MTGDIPKAFTLDDPDDLRSILEGKVRQDLGAPPVVPFNTCMCVRDVIPKDAETMRPGIQTFEDVVKVILMNWITKVPDFSVLVPHVTVAHEIFGVFFVW